MAKNKDQNDELIVDVEEVYSKTETFIDENKNTLIGIIAAIAIVIGGYFSYKSFYLAPKQKAALEEMFMAEKYFGLDSMKIAIDGTPQFKGFIEIADEYSGTKAGNLANYYLGIAFLRTGEFQDALTALNQFDADDEVLGTIALGAMGDAYLELGDKEKAVSHYEKAANRRENEFTTPLYLMKAGMVYELLGAYDDALTVYNTIKDNYKTSAEAGNIEKYISRAEAKL